METPAEPQVKSPKFNRKTLIFGLIFSLIILISVAVYAMASLSPKSTSEETAKETVADKQVEGWKLYQSKDFGYEINYPPHWSWQEFPVDSDGFSRTILGLQADNPALREVRHLDSLSNFVVVLRIATPLSLENWLKEHLELKAESKNITVAGQPAVQINAAVVGEDNGRKAITTLVKHNGSLLIISVLMTVEKESEIQGIYGKMVSSLKFNSTETEKKETEATDWKTYKHPSTGFSFKVPPDWKQYKEEADSVTFRSYSAVGNDQGLQDDFGEIETELNVSLTTKEPSIEEKALWAKLQTAKIGDAVDSGVGYSIKKLKAVNLDGCQAIAIYTERGNKVDYGVVCLETDQYAGLGFSPENAQVFEKNQSVYDEIVSTFKFK